MEPQRFVSLVIPAFNEETRLPPTLDEALPYLEARAATGSFIYEVIVVDGGSTDQTLEVVREYVRRYPSGKVRVIEQGFNHGKGAAVIKGVLAAQGELVLVMDADGAVSIGDMEKLESAILSAHGSSDATVSEDLIAACGLRRGSRKWYRKVLSTGFRFCVRALARTGVRDTQCGFKMFTRAAARQVFPNVRLKRWCFDVEVLYLCKRLQVETLEVPVEFTDVAGSKVRLTTVFQMFFDLVLMVICYTLNLWKVRKLE